MRRLGQFASIALGALLLSGCTLVPTDSTPRSVSPSAVPSGLLNGGGAKTTSDETLWFIGANGAAVPRTVRLATPVTVASVVRALARAPRTLRSAVPAELQIDRAVIAGTTANVIVHEGLRTLSPTRRLDMMNQMVRSLRGLYGVTTLILSDQSDGTVVTLDAPAN